MIVALIAALGWALTLLAKNTGHPYRDALVVGVMSLLILIMSSWKRARRKS